MKIKLDTYSDLGKCAMGTLLDEFDTEKDHIFVLVKEPSSWANYRDCEVEVKIESVEDLAKWLWNIAGMSTGSADGYTWHFNNCQDWWHREYDTRIAKDDAKYQEILDKLPKMTDEKKIKKLKEKLSWYDTTVLKNMVERLDKEKLVQIEKLKEANNVHT